MARRLAFSGTDKTGRTQLWIRSLDGSLAQPLAGTDGATFPFWSHHSRFVAFQSQGKLKKVEATGGPTTTLTDAVSNSAGAWSRDNVILFTPKGGEPLYRISALGGTPTPATTLDAANGDAQHWFDTAQSTPGSWWPRWAGWLAQHSGPAQPAAGQLGNETYPVIEPAPGRYVMQKT